MSSYGTGYRHEGNTNFSQYKDYGYSSAAGLADMMTEEVLMNLAANNIAESNKCMVNFYDQFTETPEKKSQMAQLTRDAYKNLKPTLQGMLPKDPYMKRSFLRPSSELVNKARTIDIVLKDATDSQRVKFDALIASIPLGNHEEIRKYVAESVINNHDENTFYTGYMKEVQKLKMNHQVSVDELNSHRSSQVRKIYNVRKGERGSMDLRQELLESGAIENFIISQGAKDKFDKGYLCRVARHKKGCIALTAIEVSGSLMLPYVAASVGLRAGLAMASRGLSSWSGAEFLGHAISRGLLYSGSLGQLALVSEDAINTCLAKHPRYLASKGNNSCEPEKMAFEAMTEASLANCISTIALGVAPIGVAAVLDDALKTVKAEESVAEIVVTASKAQVAASKTNGISVKMNEIPTKEFYAAVRNNYEQVFPDEIIKVLSKTDESLDPSRLQLGSVMHDNKIAGTWRVYEATKKSAKDPGDILPYMRANALRNVPPNKADEIIKAEIASGKRVAEMGKFSVDYRLDPAIKGEVVKTIEKNWLKMADENPDAVLVAHVGTKLHVRLYRKYGFKVVEEYKVPGTDITEWILTSTGKDFSETLRSIK